MTARSQPFWALPPVVLALLVTKTPWGDRPQLFTLALFAAVLAHRDAQAWCGSRIDLGPILERIKGSRTG